ncbi:MAG: hypothetical protein DMF54_11950 [Acidobacteria bacterium]|nr:MAG: hypothetical protein DMF54_11950 [Acidobacteriota bacterium]
MDIYLRTIGFMRIAVLWQSMSGYFNASLRALNDLPGVEVCLAHRSPSPDAPFDPTLFGWLNPQYAWDHHPSVPRLEALLKDFDPDAILVNSWHVSAYRAALKRLRRPITRVLCMDNPWLGTPKQWLGRLTWRQYIRPLFDMAFVPGERQAAFASRLGFRNSHILRGLYCADTNAFTRTSDATSSEKAFLFVGRLSTEKGMSTLIDAYARYRRASPSPWPLRIAGTGPLLRLANGSPGIEYLGFVQPVDMPQVMWAATSLVLPSRFEPWGVAVHEATIAGLIPICSVAVGAAVHLVQDGYNGYIVPVDNPGELASTMNSVSRRSTTEIEGMQRASRQMSLQLSSTRWARYLVDMLARATSPTTSISEAC